MTMTANILASQWEAMQLLIDEGHPDELERMIYVRLGARPFAKTDTSMIDDRRQLYVDFLERSPGRYHDPVSAPVLVSLVYTGTPEAGSIEDRRQPGWEFRLHSQNRNDLLHAASVLSDRLDRTLSLWFPTPEEYSDGLHVLTLGLRPG